MSKENILRLLKPKSIEEVNKAIEILIEDNTSIIEKLSKEDALEHVTNVLINVFETLDEMYLLDNLNVKDDIIEYMSKKEFTEALIYVLKQNLENIFDR